MYWSGSGCGTEEEPQCLALHRPIYEKFDLQLLHESSTQVDEAEATSQLALKANPLAFSSVCLQIRSAGGSLQGAVELANNL